MAGKKSHPYAQTCHHLSLGLICFACDQASDEPGIAACTLRHQLAKTSFAMADASSASACSVTVVDSGSHEALIVSPTCVCSSECR